MKNIDHGKILFYRQHLIQVQTVVGQLYAMQVDLFLHEANI